MTKPLKIIKIGNSAGVVLPKEILARLRVELGDELSVSETPGGFALTRHDADFEEQMKAAREVMARRRNALRELAK
ncbi:AbrB/MazE/SpoVT family DNA-binding domain-containing protein [Sphingomonas sp. dw_22]|uniref:AbrB/MazE/SpoVT family DNA-binding domain-containing protein n=1 Tax=Sphingomonas sp. dw_22 TaxID=2721175 RepID=UPI001BD5C99A|nr:AbrB/MazE/SpoVT family DNA-binding domain-containing protein [Sphingomonas sp. dw_22]